jgi:delta 1-pyrroline-5-carboxylate dehydrogenase
MEYAAEGTIAPMVACARGAGSTPLPGRPRTAFRPRPIRTSYEPRRRPGHAETLAASAPAADARWDLARFDAEVRESQARPLGGLRGAAQRAPTTPGTPAAARASERYMRNHMDLNVLEAAQRFPELSEIETLDTGKPLQETLVADAASGADALEFFGNLAGTIAGERMQFGADWAYTMRVPLGVCVGIGAWNYPTQIACWKGAPALACGNVMVFKPSEETPLAR